LLKAKWKLGIFRFGLCHLHCKPFEYTVYCRPECNCHISVFSPNTKEKGSKTSSWSHSRSNHVCFLMVGQEKGFIVTILFRINVITHYKSSIFLCLQPCKCHISIFSPNTKEKGSKTSSWSHSKSNDSI